MLFNSINFNLDPSGREIHAKGEYFTSFRDIGLGLTLGYKSDPYHIKFMDDYFNLIPSISNYRIIILSDHGSRINKQDISSLSTIFAFKDYKSKFDQKRLSFELVRQE